MNYITVYGSKARGRKTKNKASFSFTQIKDRTLKEIEYKYRPDNNFKFVSL